MVQRLGLLEEYLTGIYDKYREGNEEVEVIEEGVENEKIFGVFYIPFRRHHRTTIIRRPILLEDIVV